MLLNVIVEQLDFFGTLTNSRKKTSLHQMDQHGENDIFSHLYPLSKLHEGAPQSFVLTCYFEMKHSCVCTVAHLLLPPPTSPAQHLA